MPHRFNIVPSSGNFHYFPEEIQFVACAHGVSPRGPGTGSAPRAGILLRPKRYHPALTLMPKPEHRNLKKEPVALDQMENAEDLTLTMATSLDESGNLSKAFVKELQSFLEDLKVTELS